MHAEIIWILFAMSILSTASLASGAASQYSAVYNVTIPVPVYTKPHCAIALRDYLLLIAGYTGRPPRAYAALLDLRHGSVTPLPMPGLEGSTRSEVLGCESTLLGPILYGYVQYANGTLAAYIWVYRNGTLSAIRLKHVTVIPVYMLLRPPLSYIVGFLGACGTKGAVSAAYVLQGSLADILSANYKGRIYMPALKVVNGTVYQVLGGRAYHCVYFTGVYVLPTGDVEVIGYAVNRTGGTGLIVRLDGLFQVVENVTLQPLLPVGYTLAGGRGVAVGYLTDGSVGVAIYNPDGSIRYARISYSKSLGNVYPEDISCQENLCVVGGYAQNGQVKQGLIMFIGISSRGVAFANTYTWSSVQDVPAVYLSPSGLVYLIGCSKGSLHILAIRLTTGTPGNPQTQASQSASPLAGERNELGVIVPLAVILASAALVAAITLYMSKRRARR